MTLVLFERVSKVIKVDKVHPEGRELPVKRASTYRNSTRSSGVALVSRVTLVSFATVQLYYKCGLQYAEFIKKKIKLDSQVSPENQALQERLESQERLDTSDHQDLLVLKVQQESLVAKDHPSKESEEMMVSKIQETLLFLMLIKSF